MTGPWVSQTKPNIDSRGMAQPLCQASSLTQCFCYAHFILFCFLASLAVVDALKTLQEKIRKLELERKQAEKSYQQFSHDACQSREQVEASYRVLSQPAASLPETDNNGRKGK